MGRVRDGDVGQFIAYKNKIIELTVSVLRRRDPNNFSAAGRRSELTLFDRRRFEEKWNFKHPSLHHKILLAGCQIMW
ncbi:hypothetical protein L1987_38915 [Smallanthus sonchifolius]|uniref:Uncharacterized protein n=1 Tax=Smallanthus sonchifolius TaxID=185202 RepID=A0ACB9HLQ0_9ASTR|nr:hypothetical protein L1987_38915 [Smallanthus sonchifolius]